MKKIFSFVIGCAMAASLTVSERVAAQTPAKASPKKVLLVSATLGFVHSCIPLSQQVLTNLSQSSGTFVIVDTITSGHKPRDPAKAAEWMDNMKKEFSRKMSAEGLKKYDGVIFDSTTGDLPLDVDVLIAWIKSGGAFIGMHAATDTFHHSPAFISMIGGEFLDHGPQLKVECSNQDLEHPATKHLGAVYQVFDEIYQFTNFCRPCVHGLLTLDKKPEVKDPRPGDYPVSWCKQVGKGKVFYTSLGHREDVWTSDKYQKHILGGINWALGLEPGSAIPQVK